MFVIYATRSSTELQVIELRNNNISADEIDNLLNGVNWYASQARTAEDAKDEARADNCQFFPVTKLAPKMDGLIRTHVQISQKRNRFLV